MPRCVIAGVTVAGAVVGLGSGWLAVALEKFEKLEDEERAGAPRLRAGHRRGGEPGPPRQGRSRKRRARGPANVMAGPGWNAGSPRRSEQSASAPSPRTSQFGTGLLIHLLWITIFVHVVDFDLKHRLILNVITYPSRPRGDRAQRMVAAADRHRRNHRRGRASRHSSSCRTWSHEGASVSATPSSERSWAR